jgi:hypothetical protein
MTKSQERRRVPRIAMVGRTSARAQGFLEAWLVDLSASGARITLGELLNRGSPCTLELAPALGSLTLSARVVWSGLFGGEQTPDGERHFIYQSGLAFVDLTTEQQAALASILQRLATRGKVVDKVPRQRKTRASDQ